MNRRRKNWLDSIVKVQYQVGGTWHDGTINTKEISGNKLILLVYMPGVGSSGTETITAVRIIDVAGEQSGYQAMSLTRRVTQGAITRFEFPIYEKEAST